MLECVIFLWGKVDQGCGTQSLEKWATGTSSALQHSCFGKESLFCQNASCPDLAVWIEQDGKAALSCLTPEKMLKASIAKGCAARCPSITCLFLFPNQNKFSPDAGRSVSNLTRSCWWSVLLSKPCCSDPQSVPWEAWGALGGYCGGSLLTWSGQRDVTLPWTWFELQAGFLLCCCLFAKGRWQFLLSSNAFGIFEHGFENPTSVVHENTICVCSCKHNVNALLRTM